MFAAGAAMLCYTAISLGEAHDASHPELDGWYEKLESGKGPCCDGSDSAHVEPSDWETQNKPRSHYKVRLDGVWADVPDEAVVTVANNADCAMPKRTSLPSMLPPTCVGPAT